MKVSAATGRWADGATWVGGVVPAAGEDVQIDMTAGHQVTIDTPVTSGNIDIGPTGQNTDGCLIGVAGGVLTLQGHITVRGFYYSVAKKRVDFRDDFQLIFDGTAASRYIKCGDDAANDSPHIKIVGSIGHRVRISQIGTYPCGFVPGAAGGFFSFTFDGLDCTDLKADPCFQTNYSLGASAGYVGFDATMTRRCTWLRCGRVEMALASALHADAPWGVSGTFKDPIGAGDGRALHFGPGLSTVATVDHLIVNGNCRVSTKGLAHPPHDNFIMKSNEFGSVVPDDDTEHRNTIWVMDGVGGTEDNIEVPIADTGDKTDCYVLFTRKCLHNYIYTASHMRSLTMTRVMFEQRALTNAGGGSLGPSTSPSSPMTYTHRECIGVRNVRADEIGVGGWLIEAGALANAAFVEEHCSKYVGGAATGNGATDIGGLGSGFTAGGGNYQDQGTYRFNLTITRATGQGFKILSYPTSTGPTNFVSDANADYNCGFGMAAGTLGKGYSFPASGPGYGAPGAHDIDADPMLVNDAVNFNSYMHSVDPSIPLIVASSTDAEDDAAMDASLAIWMAQNDDAPPHVVSVAALNAHIQAGWTPTNPALNATAGNGTMGAMPLASGSPPSTLVNHHSTSRATSRAIQRGAL